ncbi:uncharacterized protein KY384_001256 [Bacidia gigantensis]|uniref:uncharacterized protein n=1 Tax=Bacidia gigantensis TaxID=2732470 RepID=UPI001D03D4FC|nr:uncharacterized protein KY384_001256 [Bacidia gigantensis]KAG8534411.1 hypothetical protein KY384_001256 [Bacidia gigantensis]
MQRTHEPFLKHLSKNKTPYVIVSAEDAEFDDITLQDLRAEGFETHYVAMNDDPPTRFAERLHRIGNQLAGVNERFAVVAYGDAASALLTHHPAATSRFSALIAYYPSTIPDPTRTSYGMDISILVHLTGTNVNITRNQEVLGIQGKRKTVRKRIDPGLGVGGELKLAYPSYSYKGVESGFAEHDLEEYDSVAAEVAWGRTLGVLREVFGVKVDVERIKDQFVEGMYCCGDLWSWSGQELMVNEVDVEKNPQKALASLHPEAKVVFAPTLAGGRTSSQLTQFYENHFAPSPASLNARLISRTIGTDRVVDEMSLSFVHDMEIPWLLPLVSPTHKKVEMTVVSIVKIRGGKLETEHVYWDQASVLVQVGLLEHGKLPVVGADGAQAVLGRDVELNGLLGGEG